MRWTLLAALVAVLGGCGSGGGGTASSATTSPPPSGTTPATGATDATARAVPVLVPRPGPCRAGAGFDCFTLRVPLDRAGRVAALAATGGSGRAATGTTGTTATPQAGRISLQVAIQEGRTDRGFLLFLTGGPGQPGVPLAQRVLGKLRPALGGRRLVLVDQRGTGRSGLRCRGLQRSVGSLGVAVAARGTVEECARRLGARRAGFATADTVADLEDVREALRAQKLALLGVSYGTYVAERYALAHPRRVSALVLDSVVPQEGVDVLQRSSLERLPAALRLACAGATCPADPAADLRGALRQGVDAPTLLSVAETLTVGRQQLPVLARTLQEAARGRPDRFEQLAQRVEEAATTVPASRASAALHAATLCAESHVPWGDASALPADREQGLAQAAEGLRAAQLGGLTPGQVVQTGLADTCRRWPPVAVAPPAAAADARLPDVPTLLLSGGLDLVAPPADARRELAQAGGRARLLTLARAGHAVLGSDASGCAVGAVGELLAGRPVRRSC